ncbi:MAG: hypothetical protein LBQ83_07950 [Candidatus Margulisbacteria bacterium]|nr:hypothetical protein [Candidatus Margulisiibacteriota bacterium]
MYTKIQAYKELGDLIHELSGLPRTVAVWDTIEALQGARSRIHRNMAWAALDEKKSRSRLDAAPLRSSPPEQPVAPEKPSKPGARQLLLPFAALILDGGE